MRFGYLALLKEWSQSAKLEGCSFSHLRLSRKRSSQRHIKIFRLVKTYEHMHTNIHGTGKQQQHLNKHKNKRGPCVASRLLRHHCTTHVDLDPVVCTCHKTCAESQPEKRKHNLQYWHDLYTNTYGSTHIHTHTHTHKHTHTHTHAHAHAHVRNDPLAQGLLQPSALCGQFIRNINTDTLTRDWSRLWECHKAKQNIQHIADTTSIKQS